MLQNAQSFEDNDDSSSANRETEEDIVQIVQSFDKKTGKVSRGKHPNSLKNLKQFTKGKSWNPTGKPSRENKLKKSLKVIGEAQYEYGDYSHRVEVLLQIWKKACRGDWNCIKLLIDLGCLEKPSEWSRQFLL